MCRSVGIAETPDQPVAMTKIPGSSLMYDMGVQSSRNKSDAGSSPGCWMRAIRLLRWTYVLFSTGDPVGENGVLCNARFNIWACRKRCRNVILTEVAGAALRWRQVISQSEPSGFVSPKLPLGSVWRLGTASRTPRPALFGIMRLCSPRHPRRKHLLWRNKNARSKPLGASRFLLIPPTWRGRMLPCRELSCDPVFPDGFFFCVFRSGVWSMAAWYGFVPTLLRPLAVATSTLPMPR